MSAGDTSVDAALAGMRTRYVETSRGVIATLDLIGDGLGNAPSSDDLLTLLRRELHRVHGTAGSLGFIEASRLAAAMEGLVRRWHDDAALDRARRSGIVLNFSSALRRAIASGATEGGPTERRLVLLGLEDARADAFIAEAMHRGLAVERGSELAEGASPWAIISAERAMNAGALAATGDAMVFVLREGGDGRTDWPNHVHAVDATSEPAAIIDALLAEGDEGAGGTRGTVLIVDDDPMMRMLLQALVESDGFVAATAGDPASFAEQLEQIEPALVVFDIELQDASGIDLLRTLRAHPKFGRVPALMLSGRSDSGARTEAYEAGADDYMLKPVVPPEFQQRIERLLGQGAEQHLSVATEVKPIAPVAPDVVVVEDDPALREMLAFALDARGLTHQAYATGPDALDALLALPVGEHSTIVLLDIDLPGMDGHSLHERLRVERPGAFQVVFISLHTGEADQLRALRGGALDYLIKPISLRVLIAKLDVWRERLRAG